MSKLELSSLYQLTMVRFKLFLREPEAIFWIFIFPILLAVGLGIAFRNRPADVLQVGATTTQLTQALAADKGLEGDDDGRGRRRACAGDGGHSAARDPDAGRRGLQVRRHQSRCADGASAWPIARFRLRRDSTMPCMPTNQLVHETGARYIDFVVPGLLGMNLMGSAIWGHGLLPLSRRGRRSC